MDSENESQPKRIGKPPLLLSQEELLAEKVKKYPFACLTKVKTRTKNEKLFKKFSLSKTFFFEVLNMQTQKVLSAGSLCGPLVPSPQSKCPKSTFMLPQKYHVSVSNMLLKPLKCFMENKN